MGKNKVVSAFLASSRMLTKVLYGCGKEKIPLPCNKRNSVIIKILYAVVTVVIGTGLLITLTACKNEKDFLSVSERKMQKFSDAIVKESYEEARDMLQFTDTLESTASFSEFASAHLQNITYDIGEETEDGTFPVTLRSDTDTFDLTIVPCDDDYMINADEFVMEYHVQYLSCFSSGHNNFSMNGEYIGNGITQFTIRTYKSDKVTLTHDMILEETSLAPNIKTVVAFDETYTPCEIISCMDYLDESQSMPGFVTLKDGAVFIDTYYVSEEYSQRIAQTFSRAMENMVYGAFSGSDYDSFEAWNSDCVVKGSDNLKKNYEGLQAAAKYVNGNMTYECELLDWKYNQEYHLGKDYIMTINIRLDSYYDNGKIASKGDTVEWYVNFSVDESGFRVAAIGDTYDSVVLTDNTSVQSTTYEETEVTVEDSNDNKEQSDYDVNKNKAVFSYAYASSQLPDYIEDSGHVYFYYAENVLDGSCDTCWCEGVDGDGSGETITLTSESAGTVSQFVIQNGLLCDEETFYKNNRVREVDITFSDGTTMRKTLNGDYGEQPCVIDLPTPIVTDTITFTIVSVYKGTAYDDTCISEIEVN